MLIQIPFIGPEIVIGIHADSRVKKFFRIRELCRFPIDGNDGLVYPLL